MIIFALRAINKKKADPVGIGLSEEGDDSKFLGALFAIFCKFAKWEPFPYL